MGNVDVDAPDVNIDRFLYGDLTKEDIEKYSFLIDIDIDNLKETLQDLTLNYYTSYINNDAIKFEDTARELNKFIELDIPAINDFINYSFIIGSYTILNNLYDRDLDLYAPVNPGLNIKGHKEREAENTIKRLNLTPVEVKEIIEYNKKSLDLGVLRDLERDAEETDKTKYITINKPANNSGLISSNYMGGWDLEYRMKIFIMLDLMFFGKNKIIKEMAKDRNKPLSNFIDLNKLHSGSNASDIDKELNKSDFDGA